jgi:hypothetical protein
LTKAVFYVRILGSLSPQNSSEDLHIRMHAQTALNAAHPTAENLIISGDVEMVSFNISSGHLFVNHNLNDPTDLNTQRVPSHFVVSNSELKVLLAVIPKNTKFNITVKYDVLGVELIAVESANETV